MDLQHLRAVAAIADNGTFTEAATVLHLSQPALSHSIAKLERELGARLFDRTPSGARLTAAGQAFIDHARRAIAEAESGRDAVAAVAGVVQGELRVSGVRTAAVETARMVAAFHRRHPGVRVLIDEPTGDEHAVDLVRNGRRDVVVLHAAQAPPDLPAVAAGTQEIVWVFPEALAPRTKSVTAKQLEGMPIIAALPGTPVRSAQDALLRGLGVQTRIVAECAPHPITVLELVRGGIGAALTSRSIVSVADRTGVEMRPHRPSFTTELVAVRRVSSSPATNAFCELLRERP